ncbi:MAG: MotA/TolQ/ExbB proton channel family protein [Sneathiella sp.]|nr:MotA/TolQ/ExbB proton channel family protein [Sneathiella sp.]
MFGFLPEMNELVELMNAGGTVVYLLIILSVLVVALTLLKLVQFTLTGVYKSKGAEAAVELYRRGRFQEAEQLLDGKKDIRSLLVRKTLKGLKSLSGKDQLDNLREEVTRDAGVRIRQLQSSLRFLELVGSLAPLLGLFGTVIGMISAFQALENAGNEVDPSILSGGIWVALLTTAAGLAVAMPTVTIFNYLESKIEGLISHLDDLITRLFVAEIATPNAGTGNENA